MIVLHGGLQPLLPMCWHCQRAPHQRPPPFLCVPLTRLVSTLTAFTSIDGAECKVYEELSPLEVTVAVHLCPLMALGWKAKGVHPSKPSRTTWTLVSRVHSVAGQTLRSIPCWSGRFSRPNSSSPWKSPAQTCCFERAAQYNRPGSARYKDPAQVIGRAMAHLVVLE
ncbi:hypothetical protein Q8A67_003459 [Cirrhinus molitorella]|uniref:Uncharacterized protein n=1 Tax=Cirrhinus molitorella TaxID=172907 RepID=A0AA88TWB1_9TELE|nr:hypothetical protein Q8A67_003459 [Cirrhinus molitorella]